tara:strand:+ start:62 stop:661 length:600 start_codon:yes stop_codon:yes gene_type:complete
MKLTRQKLKEIIKEEIQNLDEGLRRFKVYVSGEREPLILMGKNEREVKKLAYMMIRNSSVKIRKVVKEGTCGYGIDGKLGEEPAGPHLIKKKEEKLDETWDSPQPYSSKEAKIVIDNALKNYAKELRKVQYKVIKDWMSKAKSGVIDYFDLQRGLTTGDVKRAHPYETEFLHKVLTKDKIINRFRKYFGGKKGKRGRRK